MKLTFIALLMVSLLTGCFAPMASKLNKLSVGMTKSEVITIMGKPSRTGASQGAEYLIYMLDASLADMIPPEPFFVRFVSGKVDAYGRGGGMEH